MTDFFVDAPGLNGLYNQLTRAADDAYDALDYTKRQCDLPWESQGLLLELVGPHERVYTAVTGSLSRLHEVSQEAATHVNAAQNAYATTDFQTAARLDAAYPGESDLTATFSTAEPSPGAFKDVAEPGQNLVSPQAAGAADMWSINPLEDLVSPAAWLRQVTIWLFGHDPFQGWAQQFSGDWAAYVHCGAALGAVGASAQDIGRNLTAGARDVSTVWRGNAATSEEEFQVALGTAATDLHAACTKCSSLYAQAANAAKALLDVVADLITNLLDLLIIVNAAAAVGTALIETGLGAFAGYGVATYYAGQAYELYLEISRWYSTADDMIKTIGATIGSVHAEFAVPDLPDPRAFKLAAGN